MQKKAEHLAATLFLITPVPFSATCMLAGSVNLNFKDFLLICITRIIRFAAYGWMVWSFPQWFNG